MVYRKDFDCLKGIAIITVVLFHMGLLKSGYLGVDAFFVINGFLVNDYKPLMHLWYVGILFEFYLILPLIMMAFKKVCSWVKVDTEKGMMHFLGFLFVVSLLLYLLPFDTESNKFYFIQYRFFELLLGGLIGLNIKHLKYNRGGVFYWFTMDYEYPADICIGVKPVCEGF